MLRNGNLLFGPKVNNGVDEKHHLVHWHVVDGLWDSNVFCVGTSVVREGLGEGEKHTMELQILLQSDSYTNARDN